MLLDHLHAGNVRFSITEIYHVCERDRTFILRHIFIDFNIVADGLNALVDLEQKLRLRRIINCYGRPIGRTVIIIKIGAGVNIVKLMGDGRAF